MIYVVGEILADMIGEEVNGVPTFKAFCGGAPFNVAVNAKRGGAKVIFLGRVGRDPIGKFLIRESNKAGLYKNEIQVDEVRNTTLAFVTLTNGERDFAFYRHDTADFNIDANIEDFSELEGLNIVHLGSLMLSEEVGREFASMIVKKTKEAKKLLSFDLNFRMDIYKDFEDAKAKYKPYIEAADIVKFSEDELYDYTGKKTLREGIESVYREGVLALVTLGKRGAYYYYNGIDGIVPNIDDIKPIDTTGAGDSFFGTFLASIEGKEFNKENIEEAIAKANHAGSMTTQFLGAIQL